MSGGLGDKASPIADLLVVGRGGIHWYGPQDKKISGSLFQHGRPLELSQCRDCCSLSDRFKGTSLSALHKTRGLNCVFFLGGGPLHQ